MCIRTRTPALKLIGMHTHAYNTTRRLRPENNFHQLGSEDRSPIVRLGRKHFCPELSHMLTYQTQWFPATQRCLAGFHSGWNGNDGGEGSLCIRMQKCLPKRLFFLLTRIPKWLLPTKKTETFILLAF